MTTTMRILLILSGVASTLGLHFISNYTENPSLQIQLSDGLIQGRLKHSADLGMPYYSYEGIPYAKPPVGDLRFEPPQPPDKWTGVLDADGNVPGCIQVPPMKTHEDEDCLYINVYTPESVETGGNRAVMVWIYGGAFLRGKATSDVYGPDYLLEKDVIVVHFNYRVNVFGFLATEDLASPGNYGLKDQRAALLWVHNNIHAFGGNPDRVTLFGESAGAASVGYQLFHPQNQGLFQGAISQSGVPLCLWSLQRNPFSITRKVAQATGFYHGSTESLIVHLKRVKTGTLKAAATKPEHDGAFLTQSTFELLEKGEFLRVPYLLGVNSEEAALSQKLIEFMYPLLNVLPSELLIPSSLNSGGKVGEEIKSYYFGDSAKSRVQQYLEFYSDNGYNRPVTETARLFSMYVATYVYVFSYEGYYLGKKGLSMSDDSGVQGVSHTEDLWYLWSRQDLKYANDTDALMRRRMTTLWTNFAKFGNPTPDEDWLLQDVKWPRHDDHAYLNIDTDLTVGYNFKGKTMEFWRELFAKYGNPPFFTY